MKLKLIALLLCGSVCLPGMTETFPKPSARDSRIGFLDYVPDDVFVVRVALGVATRVILPPGESIIESGVGFPASCANEASEWCITATKGESQIWVKPFPGATSNNLELRTTAGDYSFHFLLKDGAPKKPGATPELSRDVFYRVIVRRPAPLPQVVTLPDARPKIVEPNPPRPEPPKYATPSLRNYSYSKKAGGNKDIEPSVVFDDGRFTYLRFEKAQEVPAPFVIGPDGAEVRVPMHSTRLAGTAERPDDPVEHDYMVLHRVAPGIVLRLGSATAELINNQFDKKGVETYNGTTDKEFIRVNKETGPEATNEQ